MIASDASATGSSGRVSVGVSRPRQALRRSSITRFRTTVKSQRRADSSSSARMAGERQARSSASCTTSSASAGSPVSRSAYRCSAGACASCSALMRAVLSVVIRASSLHDEMDGRKVHRSGESSQGDPGAGPCARSTEPAPPYTRTITFPRKSPRRRPSSAPGAAASPPSTIVCGNTSRPSQSQRA
jgi:hypothetical protein